jgi:hypothetical protein
VEEITLVLPLILVVREEENENVSPFPPGNTLNPRTLPRPMLMKTSRNGNYVLNASAKQQRNKVFKLSHFDADHDPNFFKTMPATTPATSTGEVNLTRVDDPNGTIPLGPSFTTTRGPEGDEKGDEDALEFQRAWCCSFDLPPDLCSGATITVA